MAVPVLSRWMGEAASRSLPTRRSPLLLVTSSHLFDVFRLNSVSSCALTNLLSPRSMSYYKRASELGDKRAAQRLKASHSQAMPIEQPGGPGSMLGRTSGDTADGHGNVKRDAKDCVIM